MSKAEPSGGNASQVQMEPAENQIVVYQPNETVRLDVRLENETVWLTQLKIAELFGVQKAAISKHLKNIFASGELVRDATVSKMETVQVEGDRKVVRTQEFFNLDVIIAVGYRVNSLRATQFRIWATNVLRKYLLRGYSVNARLNQLEDTMHRNLAKHDQRIAVIEDKVDFFVQTQTPPLQGVFYNGQLWDARALVPHQEVGVQSYPVERAVPTGTTRILRVAAVRGSQSLAQPFTHRRLLADGGPARFCTAATRLREDADYDKISVPVHVKEAACETAKKNRLRGA